tara:strand:+ start:2294 stop:2521 length:228 start_codon:yes stop_codon:yes gene_type:complete
MSNTYTKPSDLVAGTTARASDINDRAGATETGFDNVRRLQTGLLSFQPVRQATSLYLSLHPTELIKKLDLMQVAH